MKLKIFTVYDSKAETYLPPFYMKTKGEAVRGWITTLNDPQSSFCQYPADFTLFELGDYDDQDSSFNLHETKQVIGNGLEYKNAQNN